MNSLFPDQATTQKILDKCSNTIQNSPKRVQIDKVVSAESSSIKQPLQSGFQSPKMTDHLNAKQLLQHPKPNQHGQKPQEQKPLCQNQQLLKRKCQDQILPQGLLQPSTSKQTKFQSVYKHQTGTPQGHKDSISQQWQPIQQMQSSTVAKSDNVESEIALCCSYCSNFSIMLNNATWETAINHIMPMTNQELQTWFYTDLSNYFIRCTHVTIVGKNVRLVNGANVKIMQRHSLLCRKTKKEFFVDRLNLGLVFDLVLHVSKAHSGTVGI